MYKGAVVENQRFVCLDGRWYSGESWEIWMIGKWNKTFLELQGLGIPVSIDGVGQPSLGLPAITAPGLGWLLGSGFPTGLAVLLPQMGSVGQH